GIYSGQGNIDIDFRGKAITVRSENGADSCIIDCKNLGQGFHFHNGEGKNSILDGFKICNGTTVRFGGGIRCTASSPTIKNCIVSYNSAEEGGGGMYNCYNSSPTVTNCTFSGNSSGYGAGMSNNYSNPIVTNCTFSGNSARGWGGGMFNNEYSSSTITNCTFSSNSADNRGGGIYTGSGELTITNCIFWGNTARTGSQIYDYERSSTTITYSNVQDGWEGEGNIDADPCFVDADGADNIVGTEDDNLSLLAGSACADAGNNDAVPPDVIFDLYGAPRFADEPYAPDTGHGTAPIVDMGAYEVAKPSFVLSTVSITVPEGQTATFAVALVLEPAGTVQVNVTFQSGDPDITVQSGAVLTFDPANYLVPKTVVLAAAEDEDQLNDTAIIGISGPGFINCAVTAAELDNEPNPNILFVDARATSGNNGANWPNALTYLQEALHLAAEYPQFEQLLVAEGVYTPAPPEGDREATFQLVGGLAMYGGFPAGGGSWQDRDPDVHKTILSGDLNGDDGPDFANNSENSYQVVTSEGTIETTVLDGFIITGGSSSGMRNSESSPTITNCIFSGNAGFFGGGMENHYSSPTITNCTFSGNSASYYGGGMVNFEYSEPTLINCTFSGNSAEYEGGGVQNSYRSSPILTNCTFSGNSAGDEGGGVQNNHRSSPILTNCTFVQNSAENGNALACDSYEQDYPSSVELTNCILWNGGSEIWNNDGSIINISHSDIRGGQTGIFDPCEAVIWKAGNIDADPCFVEPGYWDINGTPDDANDDFWVEGDYHLQSVAGRWDPNGETWVQDEVSSPCIDAGDPNTCIGFEPNPNGDVINMGAYGGTTEASMSPSGVDCISADHPDYDEWVQVGEPICWCYQTQCHGDADCRSQGTQNYWVSTEDLDILITAWNKSFSEIDGQMADSVPLICADFDHKAQGKQEYRVSTNDLDILIANWQIPNGPNPDCP
ncbi:MAG: right-handed parallel beta-helix repeat-containing protein, partial [Planctomycetota bacterium]